MPEKVFFTSYARLDNDDEALSDVVKMLVSRVKKKFGEEVDSFFDTEALENGADWQKRLGAALREMRVMICMCSPGYLKSAFCAKELAVFRARLEDAGPDAGVAILPLIWEPTPLPQTIGRLHQAKDPRFPADYVLVGLWKYSQLKAQQDNFIEIVDAIAADIHAAYTKSKLQPWPKEVDYDELPDSFDDPHREPYGAALTVLDEKKSRWKPGNVDATVGAIFDDVARVLTLCWRDVPIDAAKLLVHLKEAARERQAVIFVVDWRRTTEPPWDQLLTAIDDSGETNFAVLVGRKKEEIPAATDAPRELQKILPVSTAAGAHHAFFPLDDQEACRNALTAAVTAVRLAMVKADQAANVVSDDLRDEARSNGIDVDRIAPLTGPGAQQ